MKFVDNIMKNKKILLSNPVLYATAIISFLNILGFIQIGRINIVLIYMIIAILISVYTKNMVFILGVPLLISNLVSYMGYNSNIEEGMEERELALDDDDIFEEEEEEEDEEEDEDEEELEEEDEELNENLQELNEKIGELESMVSS